MLSRGGGRSSRCCCRGWCARTPTGPTGDASSRATPTLTTCAPSCTSGRFAARWATTFRKRRTAARRQHAATHEKDATWPSPILSAAALAAHASVHPPPPAQEPLDTERLARCYPDGAVIELADLRLWVSEDAEGHDGRFYNQWAMLQRCHELMVRSLGAAAPDYVIRGRPDLRPSCIPRPLEACGGGSPYLALQDYLWGSDAYFYGDAATMATICTLAQRRSREVAAWTVAQDASVTCARPPLHRRYEEMTARLGHASSEPMMEAHIKDQRLNVVHFSRCFSIDRS